MVDYSKYTDEQLVQKSLEDVDFFSVLIERYEEPLKRYVMRISDFSHEESEEILQEVFIKTWKNLNDYDEETKFSSWIYSIAHNQTVSEYRKQKTRGRKNQIFMDEEIFANLPSEMDLKTEINTKLNSKIVHEILNFLPLKYKEVLILKFLEQKSYEEISDIIKKPQGTVATLINRAKKEFKKTLLRKNLTLT